MITPYIVTVIKYCPQCEPRPERPKNRNPLNPNISFPEICPTHAAENRRLIAESRTAKKVKVCAPGESGRDKKSHQESLFNPHRRKKLHEKRSKNQPP